MAHAENAPGRLAANRESLRQDVVERLARRQPRLQGGRHRLQLGVGHRAVFLGEILDLSDDRRVPLQLSFAVRAEYFRE